MSQPLTVYKVLTIDELGRFQRDGRFDGSADDQRDGFIHLSTAEQLTGTLERHFAGREDLAIAAVDLNACGSSLKWEKSRSGQLFPHLYGPLLLEIVVAYGPLEQGDDKRVKLPVAG